MNLDDLLLSLKQIDPDNVGMLTGVIAIAISIISLRRVNKIESQNLRMARGNSINSIEILLGEANSLGEKANNSRTNYLAAAGRFNSGTRIKWEEFYKESQKSIKIIFAQFEKVKVKKPTSKYLEKDILDLDMIEKKINKIITDYKESIAEDNQSRDKLFQIHQKIGNSL